MFGFSIWAEFPFLTYLLTYLLTSLLYLSKAFRSKCFMLQCFISVSCTIEQYCTKITVYLLLRCLVYTCCHFASNCYNCAVRHRALYTSNYQTHTGTSLLNAIQIRKILVLSIECIAGHRHYLKQRCQRHPADGSLVRKNDEDAFIPQRTTSVFKIRIQSDSGLTQ